ncbi:uncharacterized protein STEHIDRAFT_114172 [Stereum hirsutum FP-91666 SS1]|uniref:uncharacterized protein n=1 Tax=Stereum hirsutum (strain FP-91666) TaxID=721885 RepID=UPI000444A1BB|nr:uncharacterized protein STEHIDRAFT_114172 [Stereum hirsutum FP-91666 SS1]EIM82213.1 hypothetical protein STEHIDRAFT_114172 [Stereum hirsutum FP-91666 SS1]
MCMQTTTHAERRRRTERGVSGDKKGKTNLFEVDVALELAARPVPVGVSVTTFVTVTNVPPELDSTTEVRSVGLAVEVALVLELVAALVVEVWVFVSEVEVEVTDVLVGVVEVSVGVVEVVVDVEVGVVEVVVGVVLVGVVEVVVGVVEVAGVVVDEDVVVVGSAAVVLNNGNCKRSVQKNSGE